LSQAVDAALNILAVDNEASVTVSLRYIFAGPRYELTGVESGVEALARLDANPDRYNVIIVDQKMPHLTGIELVSAIKQRGFPGTIMVLSVQLSPEIREAYERMDVHVMFGKPFDVPALRSAVDQLASAQSATAIEHFVSCSMISRGPHRKQLTMPACFH
jgi:CheY-like chemotaxis protein